jgi:hypothetical protein
MSDKNRYTPKNQPNARTTAFDNAEEAWLWFILAQEARNEGARITSGAGLIARPCEPTDILNCIDRLYRHRRLVMDHLLVLRHYGKRQMPPDPRRIKEVRAFALWKEALERIEPILVTKGIVRPKLSLPKPGRYWAHQAIIYEGGLSA